MRSPLLLGLLCMACTRPNPAFGDETVGSGKGDAATDGESSTGELPPATTGATGSASATVADGTADTNEPQMDLPSACDWQPTDGLTIELGTPASFEGACPEEPIVRTVKLSSVNGNEVVLESCAEGCDPCFGVFLDFAIPPLTLHDHVPEGTCLDVEAQVPLPPTERCRWGSVTLHDPLSDAAFVIATTGSAEPTPAGLFLLGQTIPPPSLAADCTCDEMGFDDQCCPTEGPPTQWSYVFGDQEVLPGGMTLIELPDLVPLQHSFQLYQAQWLHTCEEPDQQLSWAVVALP